MAWRPRPASIDTPAVSWLGWDPGELAVLGAAARRLEEAFGALPAREPRADLADLALPPAAPDLAARMAIP